MKYDVVICKKDGSTRVLHKARVKESLYHISATGPDGEKVVIFGHSMDSYTLIPVEE